MLTERLIRDTPPGGKDRILWDAQIKGHRVVKHAPKPLDTVDLRMVGRREEQSHLGIVRHPPPSNVAFVDCVVVENEHQTLGRSIGALELMGQSDEQQ